MCKIMTDGAMCEKDRTDAFTVCKASRDDVIKNLTPIPQSDNADI